jgi:cytochrome c oxidase subunit 2
LAAAAAALLAVTVAPTGRAQRTEPRVIEILAKRFAFEPAVVEVAVGETVRLVVRSGDGAHGFAIEKLDVSREIPRGGDPVVIDLVARDAGRFPILCSEYCGSGHDDMKGALVVRARDAPPPDDAPGPVR